MKISLFIIVAIFISCSENLVEFWKKTSNNEVKTVYWYLVNDFEDENNRIEELTNLIMEIIYNDPEYKSLPPRNGSYL